MVRVDKELAFCLLYIWLYNNIVIVTILILLGVIVPQTI